MDKTDFEGEIMATLINDIISVYEYESERMSWKTEGDRRYHILSYQFTGSYDHTVNGNVISVCGGSLFFINKKDPYTVKCRERGRSLCVSFSGESDLDTEACIVHVSPGAKTLFNQIMNRHSLSSKADKYFITARIYELLSLMIAKNESEGNPRLSDTRVSRIKKHIVDNYRRPDFYVDELTEITGVGKPQLRKLFKREYGTTPTQYVIDLRLNTAAELLGEGHMSISEISVYVGYEDVFYFSRLFKKRFGVSPREYRGM